MPDKDDELQERVCRGCDRTYRYPVPHSLASRFYCDDCMQLDPRIRAQFELLNKRVKALASKVEKLTAPSGAARSAAAERPARGEA